LIKLNKIFLLAFFVLLISCGQGTDREAASLIEKSLAAHEKGTKWEDISQIQFRKQTRLYFENGEIESESDQILEFRLKPYFEGKMTWNKDSILHVGIWDGSKMRYQMGENSIQNPDFLKSKKNELDAAFFTVAQPWKLLGEGINKSYEGQKVLENGETVEVIAVDYGEGSDLWWYYFNPETSLLAATEIQLASHRSLVYTLTHELAQGLVLHGKRESYRVEESGEKMYLRADYTYSDYKITTD